MVKSFSESRMTIVVFIKTTVAIVCLFAKFLSPSVTAFLTARHRVTPCPDDSQYIELRGVTGNHRRISENRFLSCKDKIMIVVAQPYSIQEEILKISYLAEIFFKKFFIFI